MYKQLPGSNQGKADDVQQDGKVDFIESFLERQLPITRISKGDHLLQHRVQLLDNLKKSVRAPNRRGKKKNALTVKDCRELKLFQVNKKGQKYASYLPLNQLWKEYVTDVINFSSITEKNMAQAQQQMLKCDLHGAIIRVQKSKCPAYVGTAGIVLKETRNTFQLISEDNKVKCIPKKNCIFTLDIEGYQFTIFGNNFRVKSSERMLRKFKKKATVDL